MTWVEEMPADADLDALVEEQVMGGCAHDLFLVPITDEDGEVLTPEMQGDYPQKRCRKCGAEMSGLRWHVGPVGNCRPYSTNTDNALQVVDKLNERWVVQMMPLASSCLPNRWRVECSDGDPMISGGVGFLANPVMFVAFAPTLPLAVCRAALLSLDPPMPGPLPVIAPDPLNSGITRTVEWLIGHGFSPTDSGDGETHAWGCDRDYPYVAMRVDEPSQLIPEAGRLRDELRAAGVEVEPLGADIGVTVAIQASYDPSTNIAILDLTGLSDTRFGAAPNLTAAPCAHDTARWDK